MQFNQTEITHNQHSHHKQDSTEGILAQVSQKFWQSTASFLEKISKKTNTTENLLEIEAQTQKKLDNIISKTGKI